MSPPPALRSVTAQTTPPPPTDTVTLLGRVQAHWKPVGALLLALVMAVAWVVNYDANVVKSPAAAKFLNRMGEVERRVDHLETGERWRDAALKGIAEKLGVFVPDPPPLLP